MNALNRKLITGGLSKLCLQLTGDRMQGRRQAGPGAGLSMPRMLCT